ncbi:MAG: tRNA uridine-5-carboxymethylaminomethyl(34) synthesis GTPase MnmE, partial [Desulfatiglandales bacterium]
MTQDTISAISTPIGPGAIGVLRLSGPKAHEILSAIFVPKKKGPLRPFSLRLGNIVDPDTGDKLDEVLVSIMKAPYSYTREDMAEIQSHSGIGILISILELTLRLGARPAQPGEFTYRAFLNGRLDLPQAEAVMDLVQTPSKKGQSMALNALMGKLSEKVDSVRERLLEALSFLEALIEFPEEELGIDLSLTFLPLKDLIPEMEELIEAHRSRRIWFEGIYVVIAGRTNAGKSSLLNRLIQSPRAIVTPLPGTTRDLLEVPYLLEGIPVKLVDTAGIGVPKDEAEEMGIERAMESIEAADVIIYVVDQSVGVREEDISVIRSHAQNTVVTLNKADLPRSISVENIEKMLPEGVPYAFVSALTGFGIGELKGKIKEKVLC